MFSIYPVLFLLFINLCDYIAKLIQDFFLLPDVYVFHYTIFLELPFLIL